VARGPIVIGYDGSPASDRAVEEASTVLAARRALVVAVWEPNRAFEPIDTLIPLAPVDIRTAMEVDQAMYKQAQRIAEQGATRAREAGLDAEGLAVADEATVARTLLRLAEERDAPAIVVGAHGHRAVRELLLGSTTQEIVRHSRCPVLVVRGDGSLSR
jgi:nucleotide-binding universal stress UspA family protein